MLIPQETIRRKRDGLALSDLEIETFITGLTNGRIGDAQVGAFAMAVYLRGMSRAETVALTCAMRNSGRSLVWRGLPGPVLDKHSTGGVGDKVSLALAPLVAACGGFVPMLSGRSLGHTGGTLDKLESIPGYRTDLGTDRLRTIVRKVGCAIVGPTRDLAPADRRLYAIRDVTATVESIPLITASILSKKLAAGSEALVMDVKVGSGAFLRERQTARDLARSIVEVARGAGVRCCALLSDMDRCLGRTAGNALEVGEALDLLCGEPVDPRLLELTLALATELLLLAELAGDAQEARRRLQEALSSGAAAEKFEQMAHALGGPADLLARRRVHLPRAPIVSPVYPLRPGRVEFIDVRALGLTVLGLGGGRTRLGESVDHAVGLEDVAAPGDEVSSERPLAIVHARSAAEATTAGESLRAAYRLTRSGCFGETPPVVLERLDPGPS